MTSFQVAMKQDYSNPTPLPDDLYSVYDVQSIIDHGYFMAGTKGTGNLNGQSSLINENQSNCFTF